MSQQWDQVHAAPMTRENLSIEVQTKVQPGYVYWDCPETSHGPQKLDFQYSNGKLKFQIPQLHYTGVIVIHE
jgi:hypothetical protein